MSLKEKYVAAMVLSGVGDAMGYKGGDWEFCHSGVEIHKEAEQLGGISKLKIRKPKWIVSDDTVLHLATAEAYNITKDKKDKETLYRNIAKKYKEGMRDMAGRAPGATTMNSCHMLSPLREKGYQIPFDPRGGGCGAAMRSMCIGLQYPSPKDLDDLIADSIESGRMTHHHPTGFLGSLAGALFTSYAIQNKPVEQWGLGLMETLTKAKKYIKRNGHAVQDNIKAWDYFENAWTNYLELRKITSGKQKPVFPPNFDIKARDKFYKTLSFSGWGGASGHDAPMIAYDATLGSGDSWIELCKRGILHSGDNDSTGVMAACWFGARFGFLGVPDSHYKDLEYRSRLEQAGIALLNSSGLQEGQDHEHCSMNTDESQTLDDCSRDSHSSTEASQSSQSQFSSLGCDTFESSQGTDIAPSLSDQATPSPVSKHDSEVSAGSSQGSEIDPLSSDQATLSPLSQHDEESRQDNPTQSVSNTGTEEQAAKISEKKITTV